MKFKNIVFKSTIKTPIATILIIILISLSIFSILYFYKISTFVEYKGTIIIEDDGLFFKVYLNEEDASIIRPGNNAIWYESKNGRRYNGEVLSISKSSTAIIKNTSKNSLDEGISKDQEININIFIGKEKLYKRLFSR